VNSKPPSQLSQKQAKRDLDFGIFSTQELKFGLSALLIIALLNWAIN
jgi:hypothetical protein